MEMLKSRSKPTLNSEDPNNRECLIDLMSSWSRYNVRCCRDAIAALSQSDVQLSTGIYVTIRALALFFLSSIRDRAEQAIQSLNDQPEVLDELKRILEEDSKFKNAE